MKNKKEPLIVNENANKINLMSRLSTKIAFLIAVIVLVPMIVLIFVSRLKTSDTMEQTYKNYALNLAQQGAEAIDFASDFGLETYKNYARNLAEEAAEGVDFSRFFGEDVYTNYAQNLAEEAAVSVDLATAFASEPNPGSLSDILGSVKIKDVNGSYAYMVSPNGIMLYHPTPEKIGQPVENAAVKGIVADLQAGKKVEYGGILYEYKGAIKLAGYAFTAEGNILIVTADYNEFMKIDYDRLIGKITISGVEGSYAYMVSPDGIMLYHPTPEKIGQPVENAAVKGIVADLQAGKTVENGACIYEYKGAMKLAGYAFTKDGNIMLVTADYDKFMKIDYERLVGSIVIDGVEGSYAYLVSPDGTMLYHKTTEKIGQPVENAAVQGIVADLQAGKTVEPGATVYEYKGADKLAGYAFTSDGNILIVTADYDKFIKPVNDLQRSLIILGIIAIIAGVLVGIVIVRMLLKVLDKLIPSITAIADFNFARNDELDTLCKRHDEIGVIANNLEKMQDSLRDTIVRIEGAGKSITSNVDEIFLSTRHINDICSDNSATSEELAAGMAETSASTASIASNITSIQDDAAEIAHLSVKGVSISDEVRLRAEDLKTTTETATRKTIAMYEAVKTKSDSAIEASKAVSKINELTNTIKSISSQTSLLALNASIEAARAGEAGRGFAVVASEIGSLATSTSTAVNDIGTIVLEVNNAVEKMAECLRETTEFLDSNVLNDYKEFDKVSEQYRDDAEAFKESMNAITNGISSLNDSITTIVDSIEGINSTIAEAADGVSDIAAKTCDMVSETQDSSSKVEECKDSVSDLNGIIATFKF